jgi:hypothetical protein
MSIRPLIIMLTISTSLVCRFPGQAASVKCGLSEDGRDFDLPSGQRLRLNFDRHLVASEQQALIRLRITRTQDANEQRQTQKALREFLTLGEGLAGRKLQEARLQAERLSKGEMSWVGVELSASEAQRLGSRLDRRLQIESTLRDLKALGMSAEERQQLSALLFEPGLYAEYLHSLSRSSQHETQGSVLRPLENHDLKRIEFDLHDETSRAVAQALAITSNDPPSERPASVSVHQKMFSSLDDEIEQSQVRLDPERRELERQITALFQEALNDNDEAAFGDRYQALRRVMPLERMRQQADRAVEAAKKQIRALRERDRHVVQNATAIGQSGSINIGSAHRKGVLDELQRICQVGQGQTPNGAPGRAYQGTGSR